MNREQQARDIMDRIRYQVFLPEVTTMGACPRCGRSSRGSGTCAACLGKDLDALTGESKGSSYAAICNAQRVAENRIIAAVEAMAGGDDGRG